MFYCPTINEEKMKEKDLSELSTIAAKWQSLKGLIKDKGYKIPVVRKFLYVASFLYIISPLDFIPEAILPLFPLTLIDDVGILAFFVMLTIYEIDQYEDFLAIGGGYGQGHGVEEVNSTDDEGETIDLDRKDWKEE
jgi:uncharacterized membrane protein YkvA (DUF1232 family)